MSRKNEFDLVVHGATGFTGRLVAEHLSRVAGERGIVFALSGRRHDKLAAVRDEIGAPASTPLIECDATDRAAVDAMVARTSAVIAAAGPYQLYGEPVVAACAEAGTDYCDLTGEVAWMRQMIDRYEARAKASGARILFSCGFDSIPAELGVQYLQHHAVLRFGRPAPRVLGRIVAFQGGYSGGTIAAGVATAKAAAADPAVAALLQSPFALTPGFTGPPQTGDEQAPTYDDALGIWTSPFPLSMINTRNVHRSNFLQGHPYGADFRYDERVATGPGDAGRQAAERMMAALARRDDPAAPKPGEGPTRAERDAGFYEFLFVGLMDDGQRISAKVRGDRDPGYGSTSKIIGETGIFLVRRSAAVPPGIWTPGAALGLPLAEWLQTNAGLSFAVA